MAVPSWTPSAPMANAAAIVGPSQIPPAAIMGTSVRSRISGSRTMVDTGRGFLKPPPSPPSTTKPSTPASKAFIAMSRVGTTWKTLIPASWKTRVHKSGLPEEVVTNLMPCSITKSITLVPFTNASATFIPKGLSVISCILATSPLIASKSPEDVSIIPIAPAFDTAEASWARAIQPIGA